MDLPEGLPLPAQLIFVVCAGVVYALVHFGVINGRKAPPEKRTDASEIVALTVDSRSIEKLAGEAAGLSVAVTEFKLAVTDASREIARSNDELAEQVRELGVQMRVTREVGKTR
jgi:hypothetical protein